MFGMQACAEIEQKSECGGRLFLFAHVGEPSFERGAGEVRWGVDRVQRKAVDATTSTPLFTGQWTVAPEDNVALWLSTCTSEYKSIPVRWRPQAEETVDMFITNVTSVFGGEDMCRATKNRQPWTVVISSQTLE